MSQSESSLPAGFEVLQPFVETWSLPSAGERSEMRGAASAEDRKIFYTAAAEHLDAALDHLDKKPLDSFDDAEKRLMRLMLSLAHVSIAEEIQKEDEERHAMFRSHMPLIRAPSDF